MTLIIETPDGHRDVLLHDVSNGTDAAALERWAEEHAEYLHDFIPDFHRLQLEHWIWEHREVLARADRVIDIGVDHPRRWVGPGYVTVGEHGEDVRGDVRALPFASDTIDGVICTEVLEHCADPFAAVRELHRVFRPGGLLLVTSPFLWPWHGTKQYADYWRFTHQGWALLLAAFKSVQIRNVKWTAEGAGLYDLLRRFEGFGFSALTLAATGYVCDATK